MGAIASLITSLTIVYSTVYSDGYQRKYQSPASLAFVWPPGTGEFPAQMVSNAENTPIWWRLHDDFTKCISELAKQNCAISEPTDYLQVQVWPAQP